MVVTCNLFTMIKYTSNCVQVSTSQAECIIKKIKQLIMLEFYS